MSSRTRLRRKLFLLVALAAIVAGCGTSVGTLSFPTPPATQPTPVITVATLPGNLSSVGQVAVAGTPTTTLPRIGPGQATLNGTVIGPGGPVGGATVQVERLVGDAAATTQVTSAADGSWSVGNILGGRLLVRAWQAPTMDLVVPQVVYLAANQTYTTTLQLAAYTAPTVVSATSPADPIVGQPANLLIQVTTPTVGADGVLRYPPDIGAQVTLTDGPGWQLDSSSLTTSTDIAGNALFQLTCTTVGADPLSVQVGSGLAAPLTMPSCSPVPTTAPTTTTSVFPCPTTTTSAPLPGEVTPTTQFSIGGC